MSTKWMTECSDSQHIGTCVYCIHTENERLKTENARLMRVIARELSENDELGTEYTYVIALKEENAQLREALEQFAELKTVVAPDGRRWPIGLFARQALKPRGKNG